MQKNIKLPNHSYAARKITILQKNRIKKQDSSNLFRLIGKKNSSQEISELQYEKTILNNEIRKRKRTEDSLKSALKKLEYNEKLNKNIIQSSTDVIKVLDLDGKIKMVNEPD